MARDLLHRANEFVGIDQRIWLVTETGGFGDDATGGLFPVATDAIEHVNAMIDFKIPRDDAAHRSGRSVVVRLSGKKEVTMSFESYIVPADPTGVNPNPPDMHPLLLSAFGSVDTTNPAIIRYNTTRSTTSSFRMLEEGTHFSRLAVGCVADTVTFTLPGDGKAMIKFEGFGSDVYVAGQSTLAADAVATNDLVLQTGQGARFEIGGYVDVIDQTDGNTRTAASRLITAKPAADTLTVSGAAITADEDDYVIGAAPDFTSTSSANALLGLRGQFTTDLMGSVDCQLISAEISMKNNYTQKNFLYGTSKICGFIADKRRTVSVKLDILLTNDNFEFYMNNKQFIADDLLITLEPQDIPAPINAAAGRTFIFHLPKVEFNVPTLEQPSDGYVKLTLEGTALATDINTPNDEFYLTIE